MLWRDQGQCSIEGCRSRYRLQPHHIHQRAHGGNHDPDNLITLCWYHHHVAIHQMGFQIDPDSPTHRRRLLPKHNTGPPAGWIKSMIGANSEHPRSETNADLTGPATLSRWLRVAALTHPSPQSPHLTTSEQLWLALSGRVANSSCL